MTYRTLWEEFVQVTENCVSSSCIRASACVCVCVVALATGQMLLAKAWPEYQLGEITLNRPTVLHQKQWHRSRPASRHTHTHTNMREADTETGRQRSENNNVILLSVAGDSLLFLRRQSNTDLLSWHRQLPAQREPDAATGPNYHQHSEVSPTTVRRYYWLE